MLSKSYNRNRKMKFLFFANEREIKNVNYKKFLKRNRIHDIIKFPRNEFKYLEEKKSFFTHFNIHETVHKKGQNYLIIKIFKKGFFKNKKYEHPILDSKKFILVKCIGSKNHIKYKNIKKSEFKFSLRTIKNIENLKKRILLRYKLTMGNISNHDKLNLGVAITKLKILKIIKPGNLK